MRATSPSASAPAAGREVDQRQHVGVAGTAPTASSGRANPSNAQAGAETAAITAPIVDDQAGLGRAVDRHGPAVDRVPVGDAVVSGTDSDSDNDSST